MSWRDARTNRNNPRTYHGLKVKLELKKLKRFRFQDTVTDATYTQKTLKNETDKISVMNAE